MDEGVTFAASYAKTAGAIVVTDSEVRWAVATRGAAPATAAITQLTFAITDVDRQQTKGNKMRVITKGGAKHMFSFGAAADAAEVAAAIARAKTRSPAPGSAVAEYSLDAGKIYKLVFAVA